MDENVKPNYFGIITADVRYDRNLTPNAKLLYSELTCLAIKDGYCFASNNYFAKLYEVHPSNVSKWIKQLSERGYIRIEYIYQEKQCIERRIYVNANSKRFDELDLSKIAEIENKTTENEKSSEKTEKGYCENTIGYCKSNRGIALDAIGGYCENENWGYCENAKENNTRDINNTRYLNIYGVTQKITEKEKPKIEKSTFSKPSVEEIKEYCLERKNEIDAEQFFDFYESKNWFVGKNKMKDWKACVRTWERNSFSKQNQNRRLPKCDQFTKEELEQEMPF